MSTYKWRPDGSDADLLNESLLEPISIRTAGGTRTQAWYYPSRADCHSCHTAHAGGVLGPSTRQLNRDFAYSPGGPENQLSAWSRLGLFDVGLSPESIAGFAKLASSDDRSRSLEDRARSWLDANCSNCHHPGAVSGMFDARYDTRLAVQNLIDGPVLIDLGLDHARVIAPNDIWRSIILQRIGSLEQPKMPPLAHEMIDRQAVRLLQDWIRSLPGPPVLEPPAITPAGGDFAGRVRVTLRHGDPLAIIHYTLDGEPPDLSSPIYEKPIELREPTTLRARAD